MSSRICLVCQAGFSEGEVCSFCGGQLQIISDNFSLNAGPTPPLSYYVTNDSGKRREFPTGSVRDIRDGKGRFDLLWWEFIQRMAGIMERGAIKYGSRNWEKGQPVMSSFDSLVRHAVQAQASLEDEDHWSAVAVNAMFAAFTVEMIKRGLLPEELDDRPNYSK